MAGRVQEPQDKATEVSKNHGIFCHVILDYDVTKYSKNDSPFADTAAILNLPPGHSIMNIENKAIY